MEGVGQWRLIEPQETGREDPQREKAEPKAGRVSFLLVAVTVALVVAAVGLAIWATLPAGGVAVEQPEGIVNGAFEPLGPTAVDGEQRPLGSATALAVATQDVVVDVQGAVIDPGVHTLPATSRVADAIAAAGGYAPGVDIAAASRQINLAARLEDGAQIRVPALGEAPSLDRPTADAGQAGGSGLIDLNSATVEQLDTLPGVGPVTAAKIIDARSQSPFAAVDELLARGVVGPATFENIRDLVTTAP
jgi:competence protein ComEA